MALFGPPKRPVFKPSPYDTGKRRHRMPRWLAQMLFGAILGAASWYFLQNSYGPKRLTVTESQQLTQELNASRLDAQRLREELDALNRQHTDVQTDSEQWRTRAEKAEALLAPLQLEIDTLVEVLPPDPRGSDPGISAARFSQQDNKLAYQVVLLQSRNNAPEFTGSIEWVVDGRYGNGRTEVLRQEGPAVAVGRHQMVHGEIELPAGFQGREVTVRVLDSAGKQRAIRVLRVR